jgi:hypothetical protein
MKVKKDFGVLLLKFIVLGFIIGACLISFYKFYLFTDYTRITDESFLKGTVKMATVDRGVIRIVLKEGNRKIILPYARNYEYEIYDLRDLIKEGDLIIKRRNSDTIAVKRADENFFFVMNKTIGKKNVSN